MLRKINFHLEKTFHLLIKTTTKFLVINMIGYHQSDLSTYGTVYMSYL